MDTVGTGFSDDAVSIDREKREVTIHITDVQVLRVTSCKWNEHTHTHTPYSYDSTKFASKHQ